MYKKIAQHPTVAQIYAERLVAEGVIPEGERGHEGDSRRTSSNARGGARGRAATSPNKADWLEGAGRGLTRREGRYQRGKTAVESTTLREVGLALTELPEELQRPARPSSACSSQAPKMIETGEGIDWATAEALAFGTLLPRASRCACRARTSAAAPSASATRCISTRTTEERYMPLNHICARPGELRGRSTASSPRRPCSASSTATASPSRTLVTIWEAQFGDFANGAQVIIDQFISSGESEVAAHVGPRHAAAARLRGPGARAQLGAARALPAALRREQHAGRRTAPRRPTTSTSCAGRSTASSASR